MNAITGFVAIVSLLLALAMAGNATKDQAASDAPARDITPSKIVLNHNETMLSDAISAQQGTPWNQWLTGLQAFISRFSSYVPGGGVPGCDDEFGCGMNHNETMVSDAAG